MKADVNRYVQVVMTIGVVLSFVLLVWGSILFLVSGKAEPATAAPGHIIAILEGAAKLDPIATINLGLFVLLMVPVTRVVAAMIAFIIQRDRKYALIALIVLAVLAASTLVGRRG